jgi:hypothetical protein
MVWLLKGAVVLNVKKEQSQTSKKPLCWLTDYKRVKNESKVHSKGR